MSTILVVSSAETTVPTEESRVTNHRSWLGSCSGRSTNGSRVTSFASTWRRRERTRRGKGHAWPQQLASQAAHCFVGVRVGGCCVSGPEWGFSQEAPRTYELPPKRRFRGQHSDGRALLGVVGPLNSESRSLPSNLQCPGTGGRVSWESSYPRFPLDRLSSASPATSSRLLSAWGVFLRLENGIIK